MAEQTSTTEQLDRERAADRLNDLASALRNGEEMTVPVGNKDIALTPPDSVNYSIDVVEKQRRFRGSRETVRIELDWKPK
ncbi:MAG: amphi-Trp domain-containing protein [Halobacteriales archaeon SW_8_66_22]|jgi:amphi-Trp domain-containing protein|nr:MAG: amphi-Trp domain-containing protein [Halobacteriales archaeon SW_8_66_22]